MVKSAMYLALQGITGRTPDEVLEKFEELIKSWLT